MAESASGETRGAERFLGFFASAPGLRDGVISGWPVRTVSDPVASAGDYVLRTKRTVLTPNRRYRR